jgi:hypothetical protein
MSVLFCSFASQRSRPEKIRQWIDYLRDNQQRHRDDPDAVRLFESLLVTAQGWIGTVDAQYTAEPPQEPTAAA